MRNKNQIRTLVFNNAIAPGVNHTLVCDVISNKDFYLKSISLDVRTQETVTGIPLNLALNTTQRFFLAAGVFGGNPLIAHIFSNVPGAPITSYNGTLLLLSENRQLIFNSFHVNQQLPMIFYYSNLDMLLNYTYMASILIETEDVT